MTGATGAIYGKRILEVLRDHGGFETHLVVSDAGALNIQYELGIKRSAMAELADMVHRIDDIAAPIASGGFKTEGMIIAPCSMKTLAAIAHGFGDNLISRAADVVLKERRRLVVIPREAPLNLAHVRNMVSVTEMGGIITPRFQLSMPSLSRLPTLWMKPSGVCFHCLKFKPRDSTNLGLGFTKNRSDRRDS